MNKMLPTLPREPLAANTDISPRWRLYLEQLQRMLGSVSGLSWLTIDKSNASLADLSTREHGQLQKVYGADSTNTGRVIESADATKHITDSQAARWESMATGSNAEVLHWFF